MKTWLKTTLIIIGASLLGFSIPFGALYLAYYVDNNKHMSIFNKAIQKANNQMQKLSLANLTYDEFVLLPDSEIITQVKNQLADINELIPVVSIQSKTYNQDGSVDVKIDVQYTYSESSTVTQQETYIKHFNVTDSSELKWTIYNLKVDLKPSVKEQILQYRTFININADNINDYIEYPKNPSYTYSTIGCNVMNNLTNPYINKEAKSLNFYILVNDGSEKVLSNLIDLSLNVQDPIVLTPEIVSNNLSPTGIWAGKKIITLADYQDYDLISNTAFDKMPLDELQLPATVNILQNPTDGVAFSGVKKITLVNQTNSSSLYIKDNVLYARTIMKEEGYVMYFIGALTIADRTLAMSEMKLFDNAFINEYLGYSLNTYIAPRFYQEALFKNVSVINLKNTHVAWIGEEAFMNCLKLSANVNIVADANEIPIAVFMQGAFAHTNIVNFKANLSTAGYTLFATGSFNNCLELKSVDVTYGSSFLRIASTAFYNCNQLTSINFHSMTTSVTYGINFFEWLIEIFLVILLAGAILIILSATNPVSIGELAFGSDEPVNLERTIKFGGIYSLWLEDSCFASTFKTTNVYVNDVINEDSTTNTLVSSTFMWPLTPEILTGVTTLYIHQISSITNAPFDKSIYPIEVQDKIVEETNPVK